MLAKIRIASGLILFLFVLMHLTAMSFGLHSVEAAETARIYLQGPWSNPIGGSILLFSIMVHAALGLKSLYDRSSLQMKAGDGLQALLGLATVPLMLPHVIGAAVLPAVADSYVTYAFAVTAFFIYAPGAGIQQVLGLICVWVHGCYGLFLWARVQTWWGYFGPLTYPFAVLIPVVALFGMMEMAEVVIQKNLSEESKQSVAEISRVFSNYGAWAAALHNQILTGYAAVVGFVLLARWFRIRRTKNIVTIHYEGEHDPVSRPSGLTILETLNNHDIGHANLCGARGRCGSCSIHVHNIDATLSELNTNEENTLRRLNLKPGEVRLACKTMISKGEVSVSPVFPATLTPMEYGKILRERLHGETKQPDAGAPQGEGSAV